MDDLLTIEQVLDRFPDRVSERTLRQEIRRLGLAVQVGAKVFLAERDWPALINALKCSNSENEASSGTQGVRSRCASRTVKSRASELRNQLTRSLELERHGLLPTSRNAARPKLRRWYETRRKSEMSNDDLVRRLYDIHEHDWRKSLLAHTADTAYEAANCIKKQDTDIELLREKLNETNAAAKALSRELVGCKERLVEFDQLSLFRQCLLYLANAARHEKDPSDYLLARVAEADKLLRE